jgi:hypothetical protein
MMKFILALMLMVAVFPGIIFGEWDKDIPLAGDVLTDFPVDNQENLDRLELVLREYPKGITISYTSASTITASTGGVVCADSTGVTKKFRGNTSTTAITFSDLDTGAEGNGTYYVYASCDAVATTATFKISASSTTPSGLTSYKRIGSFVNASSDITPGSVTNDSEPVDRPRNGDWSSKSVDSTYQAATDGQFVGYIYCDDFAILTIKTDSSSSPSTTRQIVGCNSSTTSLYSTFSVPVKKNDYYTATKSGSSDVYSSAAYFLPNGG